MSTHNALFGRSLVFSFFHLLLVVYYSRIIFFGFLLKLYNLQKHENIKTLNYDQKVPSVYQPLELDILILKSNKLKVFWKACPTRINLMFVFKTFPFHLLAKPIAN